MYSIYKFTSPSNKSYIGQTNNLKNRNSHHSKHNDGCRAFNNAVKKYGFDNFVQEILAENLTLEQANAIEDNLILQYNTLSPNGYNLKRGGNNKKYSEESKKKMSIAAKKKGPLATEIKLKISKALKGKTPWNKGKYHSEETKLKISLGNMGRVVSEETRKKQSLNNLGKNLGRKHSEETKQKMRGKRNPYGPRKN